jgi:hypothetical protein
LVHCPIQRDVNLNVNLNRIDNSVVRQHHGRQKGKRRMSDYPIDIPAELSRRYWFILVMMAAAIVLVAAILAGTIA